MGRTDVQIHPLIIGALVTPGLVLCTTSIPAPVVRTSVTLSPGAVFASSIVPTPTLPAFPNAANTGYQLSPGYTGSLTTPPQVSLGPSDSGTSGHPTIFEGYHFVDQDLFLQSGAHDIIIRGCWFENTDTNGACVKSNADGTVHDITIEYNQINGGNGTTRSVEYGVQLWGDNYEVAYNNMYYLPDHMQINGANTYVHDNYAHAVTFQTGDHCDTFQSNNGSDGGRLIHNTFFLDRATDGTVMDQTACASLFQDDNNTGYTNWTVDNNLVLGPVGGGSAFYCGYEPAKGAGRLHGSNVLFTNNNFYYLSSTSGSTFAAEQTWGSNGNVKSGNIWFNGPLIGQTVT